MTRSFVTLLGLALLAGCSKDPSDTSPLPDVGTEDSGNNSTPDIGNVDPDESCTRVDVIDEVGERIEREFFETENVSEVSCGVGGARDGAWIGRVEFDKAYSAEIRVDGLPRADDMLTLPPAPYWELREARCETGAVFDCSNARTKLFEVQPDTPYYIVVNGLLNSGGVQVQIDLRDIVCEAGVSGCVDSELSSCNDTGTDFSTIGCAGDCADGVACAGDTCVDALQVELEPDVPFVFDGGRAAYTNVWDADGLDNCNPNEPGMVGGPSLGVDFFVSFNGLAQGQTLTLDAEQSEGNMAFYVLPACDPTRCAAAGIFDAANNNRFEHIVDSDGDVLVAVEALGDDLGRAFIVEATVSSP